MQKARVFSGFLGAALVIITVAVVWSYRGFFFPQQQDANAPASASPPPAEKSTVLELSAQARKNLCLVSKIARPTDYWRTVVIPAVVQDRPGVSDRGVTSPAAGVVSEIHAYPGDTLRPGQSLATIQLFSEYLQATQTQLFKANREIGLLQKEIDRLSGVASLGAISQRRIIELKSDISRQKTLMQAAQQELLTRGFTSPQVEQVEAGEFVSTVKVTAPPARAVPDLSGKSGEESIERTTFTSTQDTQSQLAYEVQELAVDLGQTVQAGQLVASLANHQSLYVVGHAFKREAGVLEQAVQEGRIIEIEFADDSDDHWPPLEQTYRIRHLSNSMDPASRTFDFFVPLSNQSRTYEKQGTVFLVWRFRPGQRAKIHVPVEKYAEVFVLPAEAVVHDGPEAYVFRQNGDLFNQIAVHVLHEDRRNVVIANDGSITPGTYLAQNAAASLNRVLKAQSASGEQPGLHVHPDGTVHAAH